jgi:hypothetical protein
MLALLMILFTRHLQVSSFSTARFNGWTKGRKTVSTTLDIKLDIQWPNYDLNFMVYKGSSHVYLFFNSYLQH